MTTNRDLDELEDLIAKLPPPMIVSFTDAGPRFHDGQGNEFLLVADETAIITTFHGGSFHVHRRLPEDPGQEVTQLGGGQ